MTTPHALILALAASSATLLSSATALPQVAETAEAESASHVPTAAEIRTAVEESAAFLLASQESYVADSPVGGMPDDELPGWTQKEVARLAKVRGQEGAAEWPYEGVYRMGRGGHIPAGYRVGGTSIAAEALMRSGLKGEPKKQADAAVLRALEFVLEALDENPELARGPKKGYDVRGWGHAYAVQFLLLALEQGRVEGELEVEVRETIVDTIDRLAANVTAQGGWNYASDKTVSPFMTGSTLLILFEASEAGFEVDKDMVSKALDALEANGTEAGSFDYSGTARGAVAMHSSSARAAVATLALFKAGRRTQDDLRVAVQGFFDGYEELLVRKSQQGTHVGQYGIAPYYFFFGHTYAALAISELPKGEQAMRRDELNGLFWSTRDEDGSWNDRIFPRTASYSTAMVMQALTAPERPAYATWE